MAGLNDLDPTDDLTVLIGPPGSGELTWRTAARTAEALRVERCATVQFV